MILAGIDGVKRKVTAPYCGIDGVRRQITKGFNGLNNIRYQHFGILEGILQCSLHIQYVAKTDIVVTETGNNLENMVIVSPTNTDIGYVSFTKNANGQVVLEAESNTLLKSMFITGLIQADFDNGRGGNICAIQQYYGAPVYVPYSYEVITERDPNFTGELFEGVYLSNICGHTVWTVGYENSGSGNTGELSSGLFQLAAGIRTGEGKARTRITFTDGVYIDNKRFNLDLDPTPMINVQ